MSLCRDDDFDDDHTPRRRSKKDISLDDIDDVGTPNSAHATGCSIPDSQCICSFHIVHTLLATQHASKVTEWSVMVLSHLGCCLTHKAVQSYGHCMGDNPRTLMTCYPPICLIRAIHNMLQNNCCLKNCAALVIDHHCSWIHGIVMTNSYPKILFCFYQNTGGM